MIDGGDIVSIDVNRIFKEDDSRLIDINYYLDISGINDYSNYHGTFDSFIKLEDGTYIEEDGRHSIVKGDSSILLKIEGEYRDVYNILLIAIPVGYESQSNIFNLEIHERDMPTIKNVYFDSLIDLKTERFDCNLSNLFEVDTFDYVYKDRFVYELEYVKRGGVGDIERVKRTTDLTNSLLVIDADFNDIEYDLVFRGYDKYYTNLMSNYGVINVSELFTFKINVLKDRYFQDQYRSFFVNGTDNEEQEMYIAQMIMYMEF